MRWARSTQTMSQAPGQVVKTSIAVLLNSAAKPTPDQAKVTAMVTAAAGLNMANGDQLVVTSMRFANTDRTGQCARRRERRPPTRANSSSTAPRVRVWCCSFSECCSSRCERRVIPVMTRSSFPSSPRGCRSWAIIHSRRPSRSNLRLVGALGVPTRSGARAGQQLHRTASLGGRSPAAGVGGRASRGVVMTSVADRIEPTATGDVVTMVESAGFSSFSGLSDRRRSQQSTEGRGTAGAPRQPHGPARC